LCQSAVTKTADESAGEIGGGRNRPSQRPGCLSRNPCLRMTPHLEKGESSKPLGPKAKINTLKTKWENFTFGWKTDNEAPAWRRDRNREGGGNHSSPHMVAFVTPGLLFRYFTSSCHRTSASPRDRGTSTTRHPQWDHRRQSHHARRTCGQQCARQLQQ